MKYRLHVSSASHYRFAPHVIALLLACALITSLFAPLTIRPVQASAATDRGAKGNASIIESANRGLSLSSSTQVSGQRAGELLVRFREGVSEHDKVTAVAGHGGQRKRQLRGESGIEKLEVAAGQDMETVARQLRLNPAVEFAEPNFLIKRDDLRADAGARNIARPFTGPNQPAALESLNPSRVVAMHRVSDRQTHESRNVLPQNPHNRPTQLIVNGL